MKRVLFPFLIVIVILPNVFAQTNKLKIIGAYNYKISAKPNVRVAAIEITGDVNLIGDPDDIIFVDAEKNKPTPYAIDDFSFLSPDGKEFWLNLPNNFNRKKVRAVMIVRIPNGLRKIKLSSGGSDISDAAFIKGDYKLFPPINKRIKHNHNL